MKSGRDSSLRIIVTGLIAQYPLGGVAWDYVQYPVGLKALGHDVYYFEDTGQWPYSPQEVGLAKEATWTVSYMEDVMRRFGLQDRWAYRFPGTESWHGLADARRQEIVSTADLVINVSGTLRRPSEMRGRGLLAYVDTDPVFTQVKIARGQKDFMRTVDAHDVLFSFGELIGVRQAPAVPETYRDWRPTRQPVVLGEWGAGDAPERDVFTTIMNWTSYKPIEFEGVSFGQKDVEMRRFLDLPSRVGQQMELAMSPGKTHAPPSSLLAHNGWRIVDPNEVTATPDDYRRYIQSSKAEWSVAKGGYVTGRAGWFSCRSACYLASGRPAVIQDTGFADVLPTGRGLIAFSSGDEAVAGIESVVGDWRTHSIAARDLAREHFEAGRVLQDLIDEAFSAGGSQ